MVVRVVMGRVGSDLQTVGGVWGGLYVMLNTSRWGSEWSLSIEMPVGRQTGVLVIKEKQSKGRVPKKKNVKMWSLTVLR